MNIEKKIVQRNYTLFIKWLEGMQYAYDLQK